MTAISSKTAVSWKRAGTVCALLLMTVLFAGASCPMVRAAGEVIHSTKHVAFLDEHASVSKERLERISGVFDALFERFLQVVPWKVALSKVDVFLEPSESDRVDGELDSQGRVRLRIPPGATDEEILFVLGRVLASMVIQEAPFECGPAVWAGLSEALTYDLLCKLGKPYTAGVEAFFSSSPVSLFDWELEGRPSFVQRAGCGLFVLYLTASWCGGSFETMFDRLMRGAAGAVVDVPRLVESVCKGRGLADVFPMWCAACVLNDPAVEGGRFSFAPFEVPGRMKGKDASGLLSDPETSSYSSTVPRWGMRVLSFRERNCWLPLLPTIQDKITIFSAKKEEGAVLWGINGWRLPPREYVPEGSEIVEFEGRRVVRTPLRKDEESGLLIVEIGPLKHVTSVDTVEFKFEGDEETHVIHVSHDQNLTFPSLVVEFQGESGIFGPGKRKLALMACARSSSGGGTVERVELDYSNSARKSFPEYAVFFDEFKIVVVNTSQKMNPGSSLGFTLRAALREDEHPDFKRLLSLMVKVYEERNVLYAHLISGKAGPAERMLYLLRARQYEVFTSKALALLEEDVDFRVYRNFDTLVAFASSLPPARAAGLMGVVDGAIRIVKAKILKDNASGVTPDVKLDMLLFKLTEVKNSIYHSDDDDDDSDEPAFSDEQMLEYLKESSAYLADLPIDTVIARDVLEKILAAFFIKADGEIEKILKAFGIELDVDFEHLPFSYILGLMKLHSYDTKELDALVSQYSQGMSDEERESMRRLYLSVQVMRTCFKSSMAMADDATEGVYDLVDLILGAVAVSDKALSAMENVPVVGKLASKLKVFIIQRLLFALNNAVQFICRRLEEPWRTRVSAVANAMTTIYVKWKDIEIQHGFGGIDPSEFAKIAVKVASKTLLIMPPRFGMVSLTQDELDEAVEKAANMDYYGSWDQALKAVLDDADPSTHTAVLEYVVDETTRRQKLSEDERNVANIAGAASQIAQVMQTVDPTNVSRVLAIVAGALAGGLQAHSVFNSLQLFYRLPRLCRKGIEGAFNPASLDDSDGVRHVPHYIDLPAGSRVRAAVGAVSLESMSYRQVLSSMKEEVRKGRVGELLKLVEAHEKSERNLRRIVRRLQFFEVPVSLRDFAGVTRRGGGGLGEEDFVYQSLLKLHISTGSLYARLLEYAVAPEDARRRKRVEEQLALLEQEADKLEKSVSVVLRRARVDDVCRLDVMGDAAMALDRKGRGSFEVELLNVGTRPVKNVRLKVVLPEGLEFVEGGRMTEVGEIPVGGGRTFVFKVRKVGDGPGGGACIYYEADSTGGGGAGVVLVTR